MASERFSACAPWLLREKSRVFYEPAGQDLVSCLLIAALDQIDELLELQPELAERLPAAYGKHELRADAQLWLTKHGAIVIDDELTGAGELSLLRDYGAEYNDFVANDCAQGSHPAMLAILAVLSNRLNLNLDAKARSCTCSVALCDRLALAFALI